MPISSLLQSIAHSSTVYPTISIFGAMNGAVFHSFDSQIATLVSNAFQLLYPKHSDLPPSAGFSPISSV
jgi:hypothetical protein